MSLKIINSGLLTTIQDTGRFGYQKAGITVSGAMDTVSLRIANIMVLNPEEAPCLEITLIGPKIIFQADHLISLTGADLSATINGEPIKMWRPVFVRRGSLLQFGVPQKGCRAYLAISGGMAIPAVMKSYATNSRAGIGGLNGKALQMGDVIPCPGPVPEATSFIKERLSYPSKNDFAQIAWSPAPHLFTRYAENPIIRVLKGPEYEWFSTNSQQAFWQDSFRVTTQSDRMGYRLQGPEIALTEKKELLSSAVTFGTVQVPPQGNPIVLMADHGTTGGYPVIAQVITADLPVLAQVLPGKTIRFKEISLAEAQQLYIRTEQNIALLKSALQIKFKL